MRLLTRSDFDGLCCGAILKALGIIDEWTFVHPKDMQDGKVAVTKNDVLANVPYVEGCGLWFDHHATEIERIGKDKSQKGECRLAPSCARICYEYYDGEKKLPHMKELIAACDKVDSGQLSADEILHPADGVLLGFIMDPRTGLGRFRDFTISNLQLMEQLLVECVHKAPEQILELPDVAERVTCYKEQNALFEKMLRAHTKTEKNVIITDLRNVETINAGNRFLIYSLFPEQNVSIWVVDGRNKQNVSIAVGYSVINRTSNVDVGSICASYGGGGHRQVGTCQVDYAKADVAIADITARLSKN